MRLITVRGIGEPRSPHPNLLDRFAKHFPNYHRTDLDWSAVYGPVGGDVLGESFVSAVARGEELLEEEIVTGGGPAIIVGYSGGAEVVGNVVNRALSRNDAKSNLLERSIVFAGLVADPSCPPDRSGYYGIRGYENRAAARNSSRVGWASNPDDVICRCPADSPLRAIAAGSEGFALGDPKYWANDLISKLKRDTLWRWMLGDRPRYEQAYRDACGYLGRNPANPLLFGRNTHRNYNNRIDTLAAQAAQQERTYG